METKWVSVYWWLRRGLSDLVPLGLVPFAGVVVLFAVLLLVAGAAVPVPVAEAVPGVPELLAGVAAGVEDGGNEVSGVGSGGNGLERMLASTWSSPVVVLLFRYLYQVVELSFQTTLG